MDAPPPRRRLPRRLRLRPEEADRIRRQRDEGLLDDGDPAIRRVIGEADRSAVRAAVWGSTRPARRATIATVLVIAGGIGLFVAGLLAALVLHP